MESISKKKLGERVFRIMNAGSTKPEVKIHIQDAMLAVGQARDEALTNLFYEKKAMDEHTFPYDILSSFDVTIEDGKATLPKRGLSILKHNSGIYRVFTKNCEYPEELIPTSKGFTTLYKNLDGFQMAGRPTYQPIRNILHIQGLSDGCELGVEMVVSGEEFTEDEFFCIPPDLQNEVVRIAVQTLSVMQQAMTDIVSDAKPNN